MEIVLRNITYVEDDNTLLNNINITLSSNDIHGIIGVNSKSKSSLLKIIAIELNPNIGSVILGNNKVNKYNQDVDIDELKKEVGYASFIIDNKNYKMTVKEELKSKYIRKTLVGNELIERCAKALKMVGLSVTYLNRKIITLSDSEKIKLSLAIALMNNPKIILLDEPTLELSLSGKKELIKLIRLLKTKYNKTIVIATSDIEFIHKIATQIYILENSEVIIKGNKYDVFNSEEIKKLELSIPKVMEFSNRVKDIKNIKLGYRDEINDLIKDIYRNVT